MNQFLSQDDFKIKTRTRKLLGFWAADLMGLDPEKSKQYVEELLMFDLLYGSEGYLLEKVLEDLSKKNILVSEVHLQEQIDHFWDVASAKVKAGSGQSRLMRAGDQRTADESSPVA